MRKPNWCVLGESALVLGLLLTALWVYASAARDSDFNGDEGRYITWGRYFGYFFLQHDLTRPEWEDPVVVHSQTMLTYFITGGWLWARGYDLEALPPPYSFRNSPETNRRLGRVPSKRVLQEARAPMVALATGSVGLLYALGRLLGGRLAGLTAALMALSSPLTREYLVHVASDAPLAIFMLLTLLVSLLGARRSRGGGLPDRWPLAVGVALGLAAGSKLTAILSVAATLAWGGGMALLAASHGPLTGLQARWRSAWSAARGWTLAVVIALGVFVLSDPHLYRNPLEHTLHLFKSRADETERMYRTFWRDTVQNSWERPGRVLRGSLIDGTFGGSRGLPAEALLAVAGAATLAARTWRGWRRDGYIPAEGLVLLTGLTYFVGISAGLLLAFPRYYLPTLLLSALLGGIGVAVIVGQVPRLRAVVEKRVMLAAGSTRQPHGRAAPTIR